MQHQVVYSEDNKIKEITYDCYHFIMTDDALSKPLIFNTIDASFARGIWFSIASFILSLFYFDSYFQFLAADLVMMAGFIYIKIFLTHKVMTGKIKKVAPAEDGNIARCGVMLPLMRSAFLRPIFAAGVLLYYGYGFPDLFSRIGAGLTTVPIMYVVGLIAPIVTIISLLYPARINVKQFHRDTIAKINRLTAAQQDTVTTNVRTQPKTQPKVSHKIITAPPTERYVPPKQTRTQPKPSAPQGVKRNATHSQTTVQATPEASEPKKVNRRRRDI